MKELSVEKRNQEVLQKLHKVHKKMSFQEICEDCRHIQEVIVTFLSILDLVQRQHIMYMIDEEQMIWIKEREIVYEGFSDDL